MPNPERCAARPDSRFVHPPQSWRNPAGLSLSPHVPSPAPPGFYGECPRDSKSEEQPVISRWPLCERYLATLSTGVVFTPVCDHGRLSVPRGHACISETVAMGKWLAWRPNRSGHQTRRHACQSRQGQSKSADRGRCHNLCATIRVERCINKFKYSPGVKRDTAKPPQAISASFKLLSFDYGSKLAKMTSLFGSIQYVLLHWECI